MNPTAAYRYERSNAVGSVTKRMYSVKKRMPVGIELKKC